MHRILISILLTTSLFAKDIIAILDLEQIGLTSQEATILTQRLTTELISLDKYQVVERNNMDKILKEQKFQHSGCTDSECAVEIGQLLNSDFIVIGSVNKFGKTYALDARLIDVGLGKGKLSAMFSMTGEIDALLTTGINSIAKQLCGMQAATTIIESRTQLDMPSTVQPSISGSALGGTLDIKSFPSGAKVYIDRNFWQYTPLLLEDFPVGKYNVTLKLKGYKNYRQFVKLSPRGFQSINVDMIKSEEFKYSTGIFHTIHNPESSPSKSLGLYIKYFPITYPKNKPLIVPFNNQSPLTKLEILHYPNSHVDYFPYEFIGDIRYVTSSGWDFQGNGIMNDQSFRIRIGIGKYIGKFSILINYITDLNSEKPKGHSGLLNYYFNNYHSLAYKYAVEENGYDPSNKTIKNYLTYKQLINNWLFELEYNRSSNNWTYSDYSTNNYGLNTEYFISHMMSVGLDYYLLSRSLSDLEISENAITPTVFIHLKSNIIITAYYSLQRITYEYNSVRGIEENELRSMNVSIDYIF